jgi:hypothetical protein
MPVVVSASTSVTGTAPEPRELWLVVLVVVVLDTHRDGRVQVLFHGGLPAPALPRVRRFCHDPGKVHRRGNRSRRLHESSSHDTVPSWVDPQTRYVLRATDVTPVTLGELSSPATPADKQHVLAPRSRSCVDREPGGRPNRRCSARRLVPKKLSPSSLLLVRVQPLQPTVSQDPGRNPRSPPGASWPVERIGHSSPELLQNQCLASRTVDAPARSQVLSSPEGKPQVTFFESGIDRRVLGQQKQQLFVVVSIQVSARIESRRTPWQGSTVSNSGPRASGR